MPASAEEIEKFKNFLILVLRYLCAECDNAKFDARYNDIYVDNCENIDACFKNCIIYFSCTEDEYRKRIIDDITNIKESFKDYLSNIKIIDTNTIVKTERSWLGNITYTPLAYNSSFMTLVIRHCIKIKTSLSPSLVEDTHKLLTLIIKAFTSNTSETNEKCVNSKNSTTNVNTPGILSANNVIEKFSLTYVDESIPSSGTEKQHAPIEVTQDPPRDADTDHPYDVIGDDGVPSAPNSSGDGVVRAPSGPVDLSDDPGPLTNVGESIPSSGTEEPHAPIKVTRGPSGDAGAAHPYDIMRDDGVPSAPKSSGNSIIQAPSGPIDLSNNPDPLTNVELEPLKKPNSILPPPIPKKYNKIASLKFPVDQIKDINLATNTHLKDELFSTIESYNKLIIVPKNRIYTVDLIKALANKSVQTVIEYIIAFKNKNSNATNNPIDDNLIKQIQQENDNIELSFLIERLAPKGGRRRTKKTKKTKRRRTKKTKRRRTKKTRRR